MHIDEAMLAPLRKRYGEPATLEWEGEISEREHGLATYDPRRRHDVTLFIFNGDRLALIRKPHFEEGVWRPPGGGVKRGEDFVAGVEREALEETGVRVELQQYLVSSTPVLPCQFVGTVPDRTALRPRREPGRDGGDNGRARHTFRTRTAVP